jgi:nitrogen regulatory protein PII
MKQLTIVVKPFRAEAVLRVIAELGVTACAVREAKGYGRQILRSLPTCSTVRDSVLVT